VSRDPRSVVQFILGSDDRVSLPQPSSSICRDIFITFFIFQVHSRIIDLIERNVRCFIHRIDVRAKPRIAGDRDGLTTCNDPFRFLSPRFVFRLERESRCVIISCERFAAVARVKRSLLSKIISVCRRRFLDGRITSRHDDCIFSRNEERERERAGGEGGQERENGFLARLSTALRPQECTRPINRAAANLSCSRAQTPRMPPSRITVSFHYRGPPAAVNHAAIIRPDIAENTAPRYSVNLAEAKR